MADVGTVFGAPEPDWDEDALRQWPEYKAFTKKELTPPAAAVPFWEAVRPPSDTLTAYFAFTAISTVVLRKFSDGGFSAILTLSAGVQCLGFHLLLLEVRKTKSVAGISLKTLQIYIVVFVLRLCSTLFKSGYLPVDPSGDWVYQSADLLSLFLVLHLTFYVVKIHPATYEKQHDAAPLLLLLPAVIIGVAFHGDLNSSLFFDVAWMVSTTLDAVALVPQLCMQTSAKTAVAVPVVACLAVSRLFSFWFWVHGYAELSGHGGTVLVAAHALQLLLAADFMYNLVSSKQSTLA